MGGVLYFVCSINRALDIYVSSHLIKSLCLELGIRQTELFLELLILEAVLKSIVDLRLHDEAQMSFFECRGEATVFVGDLPPYHSKEDLHNVFCHFGPVEHIKLHRDQCYAFVQFDCKAAAQRALQSCHERPLIVAGHELRVNQSYGMLPEWKVSCC